MACRDAYETQKNDMENNVSLPSISEPVVAKTVSRLLFGVDTKHPTNELLQNNLEHFEWIVRNKIYPNFCARYINGETCLTKKEIEFLHNKGCKIAAIYKDDNTKQTKEQGVILAKKIDICALELGIPEGVAIFLEIGENETVTSDFMRGFAKSLMIEGYTPGFKANTDAKFIFDREFSKSMQIDKDIIKKCLVWATSPTIVEYDNITTSHLIHPDDWMPYSPSGITRNEIAIWQYGQKCHPIENNMNKLTTFNLNLVRNEQVIIDNMF